MRFATAVSILVLAAATAAAQERKDASVWPSEFAPSTYDLHARHASAPPLDLDLNHAGGDSLSDIYVPRRRSTPDGDRYEERREQRSIWDVAGGGRGSGAEDTALGSSRSASTESCHAGSLCSATRAGSHALSDLFGE